MPVRRRRGRPARARCDRGGRVPPRGLARRRRRLGAERTGVIVARDTIRGVDEHGDGAVVLLHTWPGATADALPAILDELRRRDAVTATVDELPELP
jgi:peptidoglycan/xylan/chitin deacetylase (PgdA/CDA1 family)